MRIAHPVPLALCLAIFVAPRAVLAQEARCLALGSNCECSEPLDGPESAVGGQVSGGHDFASSPDPLECWGRGGDFLLFDVAETHSMVPVTGWGNATYALRQTGGLMWFYARIPSAFTARDKTVCYRYYKQVPSDYGSTGAGPTCAALGCPFDSGPGMNTCRNKLISSGVTGQQMQLEEEQQGDCPPLGEFRPISISIDSGPGDGNYGFDPPISFASCVSAPCRIELCIDGNITAGTNIQYRAQIVPVSTGVVHSAITPVVDPAGTGPTHNYVWGGDMYHTGPNDADHGFWMSARWQADTDQWIGAASEIEGAGDTVPPQAPTGLAIAP